MSGGLSARTAAQHEQKRDAELDEPTPQTILNWAVKELFAHQIDAERRSRYENRADGARGAAGDAKSEGTTTAAAAAVRVRDETDRAFARGGFPGGASLPSDRTLTRWHDELRASKARNALSADLARLKQRLQASATGGIGCLMLRATLNLELSIDTAHDETLLAWMQRINARVPSAYLFAQGRSVKAKPGPTSASEQRAQAGLKPLFASSKRGKTKVRDNEQYSAQVHWKFEARTSSYGAASGAVSDLHLVHELERLLPPQIKVVVVQLAAAYGVALHGKLAVTAASAVLSPSALAKAAIVEDLHNMRELVKLAARKPLFFSQDGTTKANRHHLVQMLAFYAPVDRVVVEVLLDVAVIADGRGRTIDLQRAATFLELGLDEKQIVHYHADTSSSNLGKHAGAFVLGNLRQLTFYVAYNTCIQHGVDNAIKEALAAMSGRDLTMCVLPAGESRAAH